MSAGKSSPRSQTPFGNPQRETPFRLPFTDGRASTAHELLVPTPRRGSGRADALRPIGRAAERHIVRSHAERANEKLLPKGQTHTLDRPFARNNVASGGAISDNEYG